MDRDIVKESDEMFLVNLSTASDATIADGGGWGTIENDDPAGARAEPEG